MKKKEKDDLFAAQIPGILQYHQQMLSDPVRNRLLLGAIKNAVSGDTAFLDVGAGTGVWAILAAKLGAKRVVAIEIEECLIPIIFRHAQENGVADRIEIIHGNCNDVKIRGKFEVIVSELFGNDAFGADTVNSFISVRDRFLAPGGILIPQKLTMLAAPVRIERSIRSLPAELPISCDFLKSLKQNYVQFFSLADRQRIRFLADPKPIAEIVFGTVETPPSLENLTAQWSLDNLPEANAFAVFNQSTFTDEIEMDAFGSQSWGVAVYEFEPFKPEKGDIRFTLAIQTQTSNWAVSLPSNPEVRPQTYTPLFAPTRLRMAQQMTPHRRFKPARDDRPKTRKAQSQAAKVSNG